MKRSKEQREADLNLLADMYVTQKPQMEIARVLGISQGQVSNDLKRLLQRWDDTRIEKIDRFKQEELHRINKIEQEMWECWEKSKTTAKITVTKGKSGETGHAFNPATAKKEEQRKENFWRAGSVEEMPRGGDMQFMNGIMWCVQERAKILGLHAPKKIAATDPTGQHEAQSSAKEELMGMLSSIVKRMKPETPEELDYVEGEMVEQLTESNEKVVVEADLPELAKRLNKERIKRLPPADENIQYDQSGNILVKPIPKEESDAMTLINQMQDRLRNV